MGDANKRSSPEISSAAARMRLPSGVLRLRTDSRTRPGRGPFAARAANRRGLCQPGAGTSEAVFLADRFCILLAAKVEGGERRDAAAIMAPADVSFLGGS